MALLDPSYPVILVDVDYVGDHVPSETALRDVADQLADVTGKEVRLGEATPVDVEVPDNWFGRIHDVHAETFDYYQGSLRYVYEGSATLHLLFLPGTYERPDGTGSAGVWSFAATVFYDTYRDARPAVSLRSGEPDPTGYVAAVERSILAHEVGHALGLVNCGTPMVRPHEDPNVNPCHSDNPYSVMTYRTISILDDPVASLEDWFLEPVWHYDADDLADLRAFQEELRAARGGS